MTKLKIKITKEVLRKTMHCDDDFETDCAISYAIRDIFPTAETDKVSINIYDDNYLLIDNIELPEKAIKFIQRFDTALPTGRVLMSELEFEVEIPDTIINHIDITEVTKLLQNHPTLELIK